MALYLRLAFGACLLILTFLLRRDCQLGIVKSLFIMVWMLEFLALWQDRRFGGCEGLEYAMALNFEGFHFLV
ncbi:hypothetical protein HDV64DRAFT_240267 [Trichoderma sp. TUCIM 5745]